MRRKVVRGINQKTGKRENGREEMQWLVDLYRLRYPLSCWSVGSRKEGNAGRGICLPMV